MNLKWTELNSLSQSGVDKIRSVAGVYRLSYYSPQSDEYHVHYVGQADDLNKRLAQHLTGNETNTCCRQHLDNYNCYFRAAAVSQQADRDGAEVALYNQFEPTCVERIPDVGPIDINFY